MSTQVKKASYFKAVAVREVKTKDNKTMFIGSFARYDSIEDYYAGMSVNINKTYSRIVDKNQVMGSNGQVFDGIIVDTEKKIDRNGFPIDVTVYRNSMGINTTLLKGYAEQFDTTDYQIVGDTGIPRTVNKMTILVDINEYDLDKGVSAAES